MLFYLIEEAKHEEERKTDGHYLRMLFPLPASTFVARMDVYGDIQSHGDQNTMFCTPAPSKPQRQFFKFILQYDRKKMTTE